MIFSNFLLKMIVNVERWKIRIKVNQLAISLSLNINCRLIWKQSSEFWWADWRTVRARSAWRTGRASCRTLRRSRALPDSAGRADHAVAETRQNSSLKKLVSFDNYKNGTFKMIILIENQSSFFPRKKRITVSMYRPLLA